MFAHWVKERIAEYGFIESQDYILICQNGQTKGRGGDRRSKDYHLTLDTAKELAMVERNEKRPPDPPILHRVRKETSPEPFTCTNEHQLPSIVVFRAPPLLHDELC